MLTQHKTLDKLAGEIATARMRGLSYKDGRPGLASLRRTYGAG